MTSKISLFSFGMYKSTVRRYIWGAVLYAIIIFLASAFPILFTGTYASTWDEPINYYLLAREYLLFPLVFSIIAPSVFTLLIFRFIHSKRQSVFIHSLPVSRTAIFTSSSAAAITLMAAPVILNGAILAVMSLCGYGGLFNIAGCLIWVGYNILAQVIMLSASLFAASLTGNSFAFVGINVFVHFVVHMILSSLTSFASAFLYGFYNSGSIIEVAAQLNFPVALFNLTNNYDHVKEVFYPFPWAIFGIIFAISAFLFAASFVLYIKRRAESAEDVAAYRILNPIFKYLLTALSAFGVFTIFASELSENILPCALTILIISAVVYFAVEMFLKKSLRVWRAYKGYLIFLAALASFISLFAFTSFFGFETRVPDVEDIESVAVTNYVPTYYDVGFVETPEVIGYATELHTYLTEKENRYMIKNEDPDRYSVIYISYKLKNGRTLTREYEVTPETEEATMTECYARAGYKEKNISVFKDMENIAKVELNYNSLPLDDAEKKELLECVRADIAELTYREYIYSGWSMRLAFVTGPENEQSNEVYINANFARTVRWLRVNGYEKELLNTRDLPVCILTDEQWKTMRSGDAEYATAASEYDEVNYLPKGASALLTDVRRFGGAEIQRIRDFVLTEYAENELGKDYRYYVCTIDESNYVNTIAYFYDTSKIGEFLK